MEQGINIDEKMLIEVLQNKVAMSAVREAQMESAIQSQAQEIRALQGQVSALSEVEDERAKSE